MYPESVIAFFNNQDYLLPPNTHLVCPPSSDATQRQHIAWAKQPNGCWGFRFQGSVWGRASCAWLAEYVNQTASLPDLQSVLTALDIPHEHAHHAQWVLQQLAQAWALHPPQRRN